MLALVAAGFVALSLGACGSPGADAQTASAAAPAESTSGALREGTYLLELSLEGGTGRAQVSSPAQVTVTGDRMRATIAWSSPNYDYMVVDGQRYLPTNTEGNSVFEIELPLTSDPIAVVADTTAMSRPHEIEYVLRFDLAGARMVEGA